MEAPTGAPAKRSLEESTYNLPPNKRRMAVDYLKERVDRRRHAEAPSFVDSVWGKKSTLSFGPSSTRSYGWTRG